LFIMVQLFRKPVLRIIEKQSDERNLLNAS
jgi:hypothetical protein